MNLEIKRALRIGSRINNSTSGSILFIDANGKLAEDNPGLKWTGSILDIETTGSDAVIRASTTDTSNAILKLRVDTGGTPGVWQFQVTGSTHNFAFTENDTYTPFLIESTTPNNTLYLSSLGRVGIGLAPTAGKLHLGDDDNIAFGNIGDALMGYNNGNNSLDIDLTNGVDATMRILTDNSGSIEIGKAGLITQSVSNPSTISGVTHYYGGLFEVTRSGTLSASDSIGRGWNFIFNEEANNAIRGASVFNSTLYYTGDGAGSGNFYGLNNAGFSIVDNSPNTSNILSATTASYSYTLRNSGATTMRGNINILSTSVASGGPFSGSLTAENIFGISMGGSFGNGSGTITVNDTFAHLSANEFGLQPISADITVNWTNATNIFVERMLYGTQRSAFHMATSGDAIGGNLLFGKQGNASIYIGDGGDFIFNPRLQSDPVATIAINNGGTNYAVDGIHTIDGGGGGSTARVQITSVSSGVVTGVQIIDIGKDYSNTIGAATSQESGQMGGDDNLTLDITVNGVPSLKIIGDIKVAIDGGFLGFGVDNEITLTHVHNVGLLLNSSSQLQFNDSNSYINDDGTNMSIITDDDLHINCGTDKTLVLQETVYNDLSLPLDSARVPAANAPNWESFVGNLNAYAYQVNDFQEFTQELLHDYKEGSTFQFHVHGALNATLAGGNETVKFEIEYSIADMDSSDGLGDVYPATTTISAEFTVPNGIADLTDIYLPIGTDATAAFKIGATIKGRVRRIASSGTELVGDIFLLSTNIHYEVDTMGSRLIADK